MKIESWPIDRPIPYARNARKIPQSAIDKVAASIQEFGFRQPIVVDKDRVIVVGHVRLLAAQKLGRKEVPVHVASELTPAQIKAYRLADNKTNEFAEWDNELLALELGDLKLDDYDLTLTAFEESEIDALFAEEGELSDGSAQSPEDAKKTLAQRFGVPPFSVLDARQGYWQERKRAWLALGIKSEIGRGGGLDGSGASNGSGSQLLPRPEQASKQASKQVQRLTGRVS